MFRIFFIVTLIIAILVFPAYSQTQIFNIPSADTLGKKGERYFEVYYTSHTSNYENDGFNELSPRYTYALRDNVEIGSNFRATSSLDDLEMEFQPNIKYRYLGGGEDKDYSLSVGSIAYLPITRSERASPSIMFYANGSKSIETDTTLTAGVYKVFGGGADYGTKQGFMAGLEQKLPISAKNTKFSILADWMSGKNALGYSSAGLLIDIKEKHSITTGYIFGNSGARNNGLVVAYGFSF